ncbi:MAG TPA: hypothetical protein VGU71_11420 [Candidatus Dormibacteraeota bacterium]|nr:hypothetical protein [Candidatus Dormibacteraeota bacterium]
MDPVDRHLLNEWCERWLGSVPVRHLFARHHLSSVVGLGLPDGRNVVVKIRPGATRIAGCVAVQRHLFGSGFPCPEPLVGPAPFGSGIATAETYLADGERLIADAVGTPLFAELLARLVGSAPPLASLPTLEPPPPWVAWGHEGAGIWPRPDDLNVDLNEETGATWIDEIGRRVRRRLLASPGAPIVGHVDWESQNLRWKGISPFSVDDWDSVAALSEPGIAGAAAAIFPSSADGRTVAATVEQTEAFLDAYQKARAIDWSADDQEICWAAGMWVLAFNAKKEVSGGGRGYLEHIQRESQERLLRAAA